MVAWGEGGLTEKESQGDFVSYGNLHPDLGVDNTAIFYKTHQQYT